MLENGCFTLILLIIFICLNSGIIELYMKNTLLLISIMFINELLSKDFEENEKILNIKSIKHHYMENLAKKIFLEKIKSHHPIVVQCSPGTKNKIWICYVNINKRAYGEKKQAPTNFNNGKWTLVLDFIKNNHSIYDGYIDLE